MPSPSESRPVSPSSGSESNLSLTPSPSVSGLLGSVPRVSSSTSVRPSLSSSLGTLLGSSGSVPAPISWLSVKPSLSSSGSILSLRPSPSLSGALFGSSGKGSSSSSNPSLSSSGSVWFGIPSPSVSVV